MEAYPYSTLNELVFVASVSSTLESASGLNGAVGGAKAIPVLLILCKFCAASSEEHECKLNLHLSPIIWQHWEQKVWFS